LHRENLNDQIAIKGRHANLHTFPTFGMLKKNSVECKLELKFKRFNENEILNELIQANCDSMSYEEIQQKLIEEAESVGFDKGYLKGISEGAVSGKKEVEPIINKLTKAVDEINKIKSNLTKMAEIETVSLSIAIAKKIVGNEIAINKEVICNIVKEALKRVDGHDDIKIKINTSEMQILEDNKIELKKIASCVKDFEIIGDENIAPGGCIVETNIGNIDARIEKQFMVIEEAFNNHCL
jgi:flagellar assembly protein FliH